MSRDLNKNQDGFTIIELLVATVVFSVLLVVMLMVFIRTGDLFYKGVSMSKTQEDARNVVQSVSDDIKFTKNAPGSNTGVYCIGRHRYIYDLYRQVNSSAGHYGIQRDNLGAACPDSATACSPAAGCTNMLDAGMQVNAFSINNCNTGLCDVNIHLVFYGGSSPDQFFYSPLGLAPLGHVSNAPDAQCNGSLRDSSLCAAVDYDSTVLEST